MYGLRASLNDAFFGRLLGTAGARVIQLVTASRKAVSSTSLPMEETASRSLRTKPF